MWVDISTMSAYSSVFAHNAPDTPYTASILRQTSGEPLMSEAKKTSKMKEIRSQSQVRGSFDVGCVQRTILAVSELISANQGGSLCCDNIVLNIECLRVQGYFSCCTSGLLQSDRHTSGFTPM